MLPSTLPRRNSTQCAGGICCARSEHCEVIAHVAQDLCKSTPTQTLKDYHEYKLECILCSDSIPTTIRNSISADLRFKSRKLCFSKLADCILRTLIFHLGRAICFVACEQMTPGHQGQVAWRCRSRPSKPVFRARSTSKLLSSEGVSRSTTGTW